MVPNPIVPKSLVLKSHGPKVPWSQSPMVQESQCPMVPRGHGGPEGAIRSHKEQKIAKCESVCQFVKFGFIELLKFGFIELLKRII